MQHENVSLWEEKSIRSVAYHSHLYTRKKLREETDEIEKWMNEEYETPAKEAIEKAVTNQKLSSDDWHKMIRFFALQDVRTPLSLLKHLDLFKKEISKILEEVVQKIPKTLEELSKEKTKIEIPEADLNFPLRAETELKEGEEYGNLRVHTAVGRATWLHGIQHALFNTAQVLHKHKWTIIRPAENMYWPTSDNPAVKLNYCNLEKYDLQGGWGKKKGNLLLSLSPQHLLFCQIGDRPPRRNERVSVDRTKLFQKFILENSHRMIFSCIKDSEVPNLIPRKVDAKIFRYEKEQWNNWHIKQSESEEYMLDSKK